jgi:hypothetical protein
VSAELPPSAAAAATVVLVAASMAASSQRRVRLPIWVVWYGVPKIGSVFDSFSMCVERLEPQYCQ